MMYNDSHRTTNASTQGPWLRRFALLTAVAIVPLILVGAGVTSKEAGMAFPDWPTSNSHLLNPPGWLQEEDKLWEHGHRLIGWVVGMLAIGLAAAAWPRRGWIRALGLGTLLAIIVQGVLGGLRVTEISTELAMVHGVWGQLCFCLACVTALVNSRAWNTTVAGRIEVASGPFFQRLSLVTTISVFLQLVLGAALRHFGFGWALAAHLIWAAVVILMLSFVALWAIEQFGEATLFSRLGRLVAALVALQLFLGGGAFLVTVISTKWPKFILWSVPSAHVVVGALLLACMVVLTLCSYRVLHPAQTADQTTRTQLAATT